MQIVRATPGARAVRGGSRTKRPLGHAAGRHSDRRTPTCSRRRRVQRRPSDPRRGRRPSGLPRHPRRAHRIPHSSGKVRTPAPRGRTRARQSGRPSTHRRRRHPHGPGPWMGANGTCCADTGSRSSQARCSLDGRASRWSSSRPCTRLSSVCRSRLPCMLCHCCRRSCCLAPRLRSRSSRRRTRHRASCAGRRTSFRSTGAATTARATRRTWAACLRLSAWPHSAMQYVARLIQSRVLSLALILVAVYNAYLLFHRRRTYRLWYREEKVGRAADTGCAHEPPCLARRATDRSTGTTQLERACAVRAPLTQ